VSAPVDRRFPIALVPVPRGVPARPDPAVVDCLVTYRSNTPRDQMGNHISAAGRYLITQAAAVLYGVEGAPGLVRDEHRRWAWPGRALNASVAHCGPLSVVAMSGGPRIGVDLQDVRDRPLAMGWLGELLGFPAGEPASLRDFAECEALIKVSHLTKATFGGVRLPAWRAGWRATAMPYQVLSTTIRGGVHLALACETAPAVRWWQSTDGRPPRKVTDPALLGRGMELT
jgi:hypothetical protein